MILLMYVKRTHGSTAYFTTSDHLPTSNIFDNNWKQNQKFLFIFFLHSIEFGRNVISEISGRLLIGRNDSLGPLLLVNI